MTFKTKTTRTIHKYVGEIINFLAELDLSLIENVGVNIHHNDDYESDLTFLIRGYGNNNLYFEITPNIKTFFYYHSEIDVINEKLTHIEFNNNSGYYTIKTIKEITI